MPKIGVWKRKNEENMIKVILTGPPKNGYFPYKVDWWFQGRPQLTGLSPAPLLDACRQLQQMGLMDSTVVGLFKDEDEVTWAYRTTVGYGARRMASQFNPDPYAMGPLVAPEGLRDDSLGEALVVSQEIVGGIPAGTSDVQQATPVEEPPEPHKPPKRQAGKGRAHAEPDKPEPPHRKRKRAGSGARRGSR